MLLLNYNMLLSKTGKNSKEMCLTFEKDIQTHDIAYIFQKHHFLSQSFNLEQIQQRGVLGRAAENEEELGPKTLCGYMVVNIL